MNVKKEGWRGIRGNTMMGNGGGLCESLKTDPILTM